MNPALQVLLVAAISYGCGSLPWGVWLGRWVRGVDVRTLGSGNPGATNVYRALGPGLGVATLVLDAAKGALPVLVLPHTPLGAGFPGGAEACRLVAGLGAIAGHVWSAFAGFRGGKGVATTAGVLLVLSPIAAAVALVVFVAAVAITRFISVGSILAALAFLVTLAFVTPGGWRSLTFGFGALAALVVIARHRDNIARLRAGTERRFSFRREAGA